MALLTAAIALRGMGLRSAAPHLALLCDAASQLLPCTSFSSATPFDSSSTASSSLQLCRTYYWSCSARPVRSAARPALQSSTPHDLDLRSVAFTPRSFSSEPPAGPPPSAASSSPSSSSECASEAVRSNVEALADGVLAGDRLSISRTLTLCESLRPDHMAQAAELQRLLVMRRGAAEDAGETA